jgi:hypothetical protein
MTSADDVQVTSEIQKDEKTTASQVESNEERADVRLHQWSLSACRRPVDYLNGDSRGPYSSQINSAGFFHE